MGTQMVHSIYYFDTLPSHAIAMYPAGEGALLSLKIFRRPGHHHSERHYSFGVIVKGHLYDTHKIFHVTVLHIKSGHP